MDTKQEFQAFVGMAYLNGRAVVLAVPLNMKRCAYSADIELLHEFQDRPRW